MASRNPILPLTSRQLHSCNLTQPDATRRSEEELRRKPWKYIGYTSWQQSQVTSYTLKDNIGKVCDMVLTNGLNLKQIDRDQDLGFFIKHNVTVTVARCFVDYI